MISSVSTLGTPKIHLIKFDVDRVAVLTVGNRGTGNTLRFACWPEDTTGYYANLISTQAGSADTAVGKIWAESQIVSDKCYTQLKDIGDYVGMAFVARDMMSIVDALGEDGMLRYWGEL